MKKYSRYLLLMLLCLCACRAGFADSIIYVKDCALWKSEFPPNGKPVLLYGHDVVPSYLIPSPDGQYVAATIIPQDESVALFSVHQPGVRRTIPMNTGSISHWFLGEWTLSGDGILVAEWRTNAQNREMATYVGVYEVRPNKYQKLVASPAIKEQGDPFVARYSPDKSMLAVEGDNYLQIFSLRPKVKTIFYKDYLDIQSPWVWVDNNHVVYSGENKLMLVDVKGKRIKPLVSHNAITDMIYSKARGRLYISMQVSAGDDYGLYSIDLDTSRIEQVPLPGLTKLFRLFDMTADGKVALIDAVDDSHPISTNSKRVNRDIWAVDLDTGSHTLIAESADSAVIVPSPTKTAGTGK